VDMYREELEGDGLVRYPVRSEGKIEFLN
jgi:hypothetical protein